MVQAAAFVLSVFAAFLQRMHAPPPDALRHAPFRRRGFAGGGGGAAHALSRIRYRSMLWGAIRQSVKHISARLRDKTGIQGKSANQRPRILLQYSVTAPEVNRGIEVRRSGT